MQEQGSAEKDGGVRYAPWERVFERIYTPFEEFIHEESTGGLLLMGCTLVALLLANSPWAGAYQHLLHIPIGFDIGGWGLEKSLQHWVNDGLMALFFFVVGLELKREILVGELADPGQAALPILAAAGGMVVPALIFFGFNAGAPGAVGWGIPMATDIAFAIGILVLLGKRIPHALITFLVALAIVDDLGGVLVIALFYTEKMDLLMLGIGGAMLALLVLLNVLGIRRPLPYFIIGLLLWLALLKSGVHATLAGVLTAFTIPARAHFDPVAFSERVKALMRRFDASIESGREIMRNEKMRGIVQTLENGILQVESPLQRLEHNMHLPVAFLVIPVFALVNAGIPIDFSTLDATLVHPVTLGVVAGLVAGKLVGIAGVSWLAIRAGVGRLPPGVRFTQILGVALLGGIGFTMSIFIADLAFTGQQTLLLMAKTGILAASLLAGITGALWLYLSGRPN